MQQADVQEVGITLESLEAKVELAELLDQLHKSRAFKKIILDMYLRDRAVDLVKGASQASINEIAAKVHHNAIISISGLQAFFNSIYIEGNSAAQSIEEHKTMLEEMRAEAAENLMSNEAYAGMSDEAFGAMLDTSALEVSELETPSGSLSPSDAPITLDETPAEELVDETPTIVEELPQDAPAADLEAELEPSLDDVDPEEIVEGEAAEDVIDEPVVEPNTDLEELYKPFKASGREISVKSVEEAKKLMSMGADYANKLQGFKTHRKTIKTLEQNGIDSDKLNLLIDASKGDKLAISKLIQDHDIDTMDLGIKEGSNYTPKDYSVSDSVVDMDDVISRIQGTTSFATTSDIVTNQWDASSKEVILSNPKHLEDLNEHVSNGTYDRVMNEVARARMFDGLTGLTDFEAYIATGKQMQKDGVFNKETPIQKTVSTKPATKPQVNAEKKLRASPVKGSQRKAAPPKYDFVGMSDDEFGKLLNN